MQVDVTAVFSWVLLLSISLFILCEMIWLVRRLVFAKVAGPRLIVHDVMWSLIPAAILILLSLMVSPVKKSLNPVASPSSAKTFSPVGYGK